MMNTIKEFTADDAMVIVGTVIDDGMAQDLRVTMIATGLGGAAAQTKRPPKLEVLSQPEIVQRTGTDGVGMSVETIDYDKLDQPAVVRRRRRRWRQRRWRGLRHRDPGVPAQAARLTEADATVPVLESSGFARRSACGATETLRRPRIHDTMLHQRTLKIAGAHHRCRAAHRRARRPRAAPGGGRHGHRVPSHRPSPAARRSRPPRR